MKKPKFFSYKVAFASKTAAFLPHFIVLARNSKEAAKIVKENFLYKDERILQVIKQ